MTIQWKPVTGVQVDRTGSFLRAVLASAAFACLLLCLPAKAPADTVVIEATRDNTLYEDPAGALSNGQGQYVFAGRVGGIGGGAKRRALLRFNLAGAIPAGSLIDSATLTLYMSKTPIGDKIVSVHRVTADWGEGASDDTLEEGSGAPSQPGDATWRHTFFPGSFWAAQGGDFEAAASASTTVGLLLGFYTWSSTPQLVADVQMWLDTPASNFGWILIGDESTLATSKRFDSSEYADTTKRPKLTVEFTSCLVPGGCDDSDPCTLDLCAGVNCSNPPVIYGDVNRNGFVTLADLFCVLDGYAGDFSDCSLADDDIHGSCGVGLPECCPNGVITLADLFAVLDAYAGDPECDPCP